MTVLIQKTIRLKDYKTKIFSKNSKDYKTNSKDYKTNSKDYKTKIFSKNLAPTRTQEVSLYVFVSYC